MSENYLYYWPTFEHSLIAEICLSAFRQHPVCPLCVKFRCSQPHCFHVSLRHLLPHDSVAIVCGYEYR